MSKKTKKGNELKILFPVLEGEIARREALVCATKQHGDNYSGCGYSLPDVAISPNNPGWGATLAKCPECGKDMIANISAYRTGIAGRGPGYYGSKIGQKMKRDRIHRSEKLGRTQWEQNAPMSVSEGATIKNPTPGGIYDPNSKFAKNKSKAKHYT